MPTIDELQEKCEARTKLCRQLKALLVERLELPNDPDWITDDQPLFGRGLELDSVDALEIAVGVEYDFGVSITDDQLGVFGSINKLADFILEEKAAQ